MADNSPSNRITLPPALGCFTWLFKPRPPMKGNDSSGRLLYQLVLIWKKSEKDKLKPLADLVRSVATEAFGASPKGKIRMPIRDGDADRPGYAEFVDSYFITASSERKPGIVNSRGNPIFEADAEDEAYSGCIYRASVVPYSYDYQGNRGVAIGLRNLMVAAKGPHLDGGISAEEEFKEFGASGSSDNDDIV